jgi:dolichol kinase
MSPDRDRGPEPVPLDSRRYRQELGRKAIHLSFVLLPLQMIYETLPWPRSNAEFRVCLLALGIGFLAIDMLRVHERRFRSLFRRFFSGMVREHEAVTMLGSSYLVLAALIVVSVFPRPVAAAALGFTILGDALAALVGRGWGRIPLYGKTLEGSLAGLAAAIGWGALVHGATGLPWDVVIAGALTASLVELLPIPIDDNLAMTLIAAFAMNFLWMTA